MASFDFGIRISAQDGASGVLSGIQQKISGMGSNISSSMAGATDRLAKFGMATQGITQITGALQTVGDAFTNYESDLAAVSAVTGLAGAELENIGSKARGLAKDFGGTASDQLKSFQGVLSKFGADQFKGAAGADALTQISRNINTLSAASGDSAAQSMDVLANAMLQMGVNTDDASIAAKTSTEYINTLAASAQVGSAEIPQVGAAFLQVGVAAKNLNMDFTEVNTAIQVLGKGGKYGAEAGVALRNVMGLMMKASGPAEESMKSLGTSSSEMGKLLTDPSQGLNAGMKKLKEGLLKLPNDAARATAMMNIFGAENSAAAGVLLNNTETYDNYKKAIKESADAGAASVQANIRMATAGTFAARAQAYVNDMWISAGSAIGKYGVAAISTVNSVAPQITALAGIKSLIPEGAFGSIKSGVMNAFSGLSGVAGNALGAVRGQFTTFAASLRNFSLGGAFSSMRSGAASAVSGMGSALSSGVGAIRNFATQQMLAARGSALFSGGIGGFAKAVGGGLVSGVRSAITSVLSMNMAFLTSPVTWIALGIAGAAFLIYKNWEPIKAFFGGLFDGIGGFFTGFMDGIGAAFAAPWSILQEVGAAFSPIIDAVSALFSPVSGVAGATGAAANNFSWLKDVGVVAGQYIGTAFRVVVTPILWVLKVVGQVIGMFMGLQTSGGNMARVLVGAFTAITLPIQLVMNMVGGLFIFIQSLFSGASLAEAGSNMITSLWTGIQATWGKLVDGVKGLVGGITNLFSGKKEEASVTTAAMQKSVATPPKVEPPKVPPPVPPKTKEIKAPPVGKPKIPKPDEPKLMPLRPPEAPDFSWIAKQNAEPPVIKPFPPLEPPTVKSTGGIKTIDVGITESLKSISTEATKIFSENSDVFKMPSLQVPDLRLPDFGAIKLPSLELPTLGLPDIQELPKGLKLPNLEGFEVPGLDALLKQVGIDVPKLPEIPNLPNISIPFPNLGEIENPVPGLPPASTPAQRSSSNAVTVNFTVNLNLSPQGAGGNAPSASDIAEQVQQALRKLAPELAREVQEALDKDKRLQFSGF